MGVIVKNKVGWFVLEAFPPEVRVTQIDVCTRRSVDPGTGLERFIMMRLKPAFVHPIPAAVQYGLEQRNVPYDQLYLTDSAALYCSELVVDMFRAANGGNAFFVERPMSFRNPATGQILPAWTDYYEKFGISVPDSQSGSNPGDISCDTRLHLVSVTGPPGGYSTA